MSVISDIQALSDIFTSKMQGFELQLQSAMVKQSNSEGPIINEIADNFIAFKKFVISALEKMREKVCIFESKIDYLENCSRKNCLLIHGIPETKGERIENVLFVNHLQ
ncbi:hypothetical protein PPYR_13586 [Photinus pyralis]|uniref:Uncharacterized protein n=1 Tax=Photinus pyralis TaxID=7054 RepID=A0A5N4A9G1_PHOPY|nr:hypothetical protein PPYR_13586 [Photinus pyralis]